jgi:hypothetical protein
MLYRLGAVALLLWTLLSGYGNVRYLLAPDAPFDAGQAWLSLFGEAFLLLGVVALFAHQAERGGWLGLAGFVLIVLSVLYAVGSLSLQLAVADGAITNEQIQQAPSLALADQLFGWTFQLGAVLWGVALYRGGGITRYAGVVLALVGIASYATGLASVAVPIFIVLSAIVWGWLGVALWISQPGPSLRPAAQAA